MRGGPLSDEDYADVELFLRHNGGEAVVFEGSYEDVARMRTRTIIENVTMHAPTPPGEYVVGIRERGDEQYAQRFSIGELVGAKPDEADHALQHQVAGVMDHFRQ